MKHLIREFYIKQITEWLKNPEIRELLIRVKGRLKLLPEISFDLLIRWYVQVSEEGRDSYGLNILGRVINSEVTEKAAIKIKEICNEFVGSKRELKKKLLKETYYEHNPPVKVIKGRLINLEDPDEDKVRGILNENYEIIIITMDEHTRLDERYRDAGEYVQRLEAIEARIISAIEKEALITLLNDYL